MKNEFECMIESLGETTWGSLKPLGLDALTVRGDATTASARLIVELHEDSWDNRRTVLNKLVEVRGLFMDELALEFRFNHDDEAFDAPSGLVEYAAHR